MPVYVVLSYIIFTLVPVGLYISIYLRQKRILRELSNLDQ